MIGQNGSAEAEKNDDGNDVTASDNDQTKTVGRRTDEHLNTPQTDFLETRCSWLWSSIIWLHR